MREIFALRTRFAPSPTGYLHIGHAYAAARAFRAARDAGDVCLLRIEDIDQTRCKPEYEAGIVEDLGWLGFEWPEPVRRQSDHYDDYLKCLSVLIEKGLVYRSFASRADINREMDAAGIEKSPAGERPYPGPSKAMSQDEVEARLGLKEAFSWRLSLSNCREYLGPAWGELSFHDEGATGLRLGADHQAHPEWLGDVILSRKDSLTSYFLACTYDDALQDITHVIRGDDLFYATHIQVLLQKLMNWPTPVYRHHRLLSDADGRKFAKRDRSKTLRALREEGYSPKDIQAQWSHWIDER